ncbi:MAG: pyruvate kinase [Myxococcota bacterium]|nr:pyruvate kinase [Myxococcota bacterium]
MAKTAALQRVKIVATLGPASSDRYVIRRMIEAGMDVVRLNFSHSNREERRRLFKLVREEARDANSIVAVLADLGGPKIRTGRIDGGAVKLRAGQKITITAEDVVGDANRISTSHKALYCDVRSGDRILIDDGMIELTVHKVEHKLVYCTVSLGGVLRDKKGMNIPGSPLSVPALTEKDRQDIAFARDLGVDYFALSFVRTAGDLLEAKKLAGEIPVIAKIEKPQAVANLDQIISASDGLMVARGDLGVEAGAEKVPLLQKRIIRDAAAHGRPVIVATQMLESMIQHPKPTRAEVSDVANAVLDGADAVMLSGESAVGRFPVEAVAEMATVLKEVEGSEIFRHMPEPVKLKGQSFSNAVARAAVTASVDLDLKAIAVYTESGRSASLVAACRPRSSIVAFSRHDSVLRRLALRWGVVPLHGEWAEDGKAALEQAKHLLLERGLAREGDSIAVTYGEKVSAGFTDTLKLDKIE